MKKNLLLLGEIVVVIVAALTCAVDATAQSRAVCPDPARPCAKDKIEDHDISFALPKRVIANRDYTSAPFYAVILRKIQIDGDCATEDFDPERLKAQKLFPKNKVFFEVECPDMGADSYTEVGGQSLTDFMAVYAGQTSAEAAEFLKTVRATKKFPQARVVHLTTTFNHIEQ